MLYEGRTGRRSSWLHQEGLSPSVVGLQASKSAGFAPLQFALIIVIRMVFLDEFGGDNGPLGASKCSKKVGQDVDQVGDTKKVLVLRKSGYRRRKVHVLHPFSLH